MTASSAPGTAPQSAAGRTDGPASMQGGERSSVGAGAPGAASIAAVPSAPGSPLLRLHVSLADLPVADVIEVRVALERLSVGLAADNATADDLLLMRDLLDEMAEPDLPREEFNDLDTGFHVAVAAAAGNLLARDLTGAIRESMRLPILDRFRDLEAWEELAPVLRRDHEAIYAAVVAGDPALAKELMEGHIRSAWRRLNAQG